MKSRLRTILWLGSGLLVVLVVIFFQRWANRPVGTSLSETAVQGATTSNNRKDLSTDYFTTNIASSFVVKSEKKVPHANLRLQMLLASDNDQSQTANTDQLAISIGSLTPEGLAGVSDVQFRVLHPQVYTEISDSDFPTGARAFVKDDMGYEKSVFWTHGSYYVSVVVSGTTDRASALNRELDSVVVSWQWHDQ
jgi:hypothetical protein